MAGHPTPGMFQHSGVPPKQGAPLTLRSIASALGRSKERAAREQRAQPPASPMGAPTPPGLFLLWGYLGAISGGNSRPGRVGRAARPAASPGTVGTTGTVGEWIPDPPQKPQGWRFVLPYPPKNMPTSTGTFSQGRRVTLCPLPAPCAARISGHLAGDCLQAGCHALGVPQHKVFPSPCVRCECGLSPPCSSWGVSQGLGEAVPSRGVLWVGGWMDGCGHCVYPCSSDTSVGHSPPGKGRRVSGCRTGEVGKAGAPQSRSCRHQAAQAPPMASLG